MVRLGQRLHQKRLQRKLSLDEIAQELKIKSTFLSAIERGEYNKLPSPAYAQGFVMNYATYLGISKAETTLLFKREFDAKKAMKVLPDVMVNHKEFPSSTISYSAVNYGFYIFFSDYPLLSIFPISRCFFTSLLTVTTPMPASKTSQDVTVTGNADSNATVTINGEPATVSNNGTFQKEITLFPGNATIIIKAVNRFGKRRMSYKEQLMFNKSITCIINSFQTFT